ncbi:serpin A3-6-like [Planococcus citri]|uniref:serpin A3-6-like n=1 Tax=Planococcus citri TaxID=170843 RepID=UPI0031F99780
MRCSLQIALFLIVSILHLSVSQNVQDVPDERHEAVKRGMLDFGVRLNSIISSNNANNKNVLFSPFNIYTALALLHLGSNGKTRDEVAGILGMPKTYSPETVHEVLQNFSVIAQNSTERRSTLENGTKGKVKVCDLNLANGIFVQKGIKLKQSYVEDAQTYYESEIVNVDFVNKSKEATDIINKYIANKTENRIPQLFKEPQSPNTRIILTSSLYFKSLWLHKFNKSLTQSDTFNTNTGKITVPMMNKNISTPYADLPSLGVEVVNLKFADQAFCMYIVMPYENQTLTDFLRTLTTDDINLILNETSKNHRVDLKFPSTAFKWSKSIKEELTQLGLSQVFGDGADLGNMVERSNLKVDQISHSTDIKINEDGTEASAVTPILMVLKIGGREKDVSFYVNRPFFFFIYNRKIDAVVFFGSVFNPTGN